jgi:AcrR family transcriptional regulator
VTVPLADDAVRVDGRVARSRRTREAVVDALLTLQEEGDLTPSGRRVAERAGIAARTGYLHFADMEALYAEAGERFLTRLGHIGEQAPPDAPFEERAALFCRRRAQVLETLLPVYRASRLRQPFSKALQANRDRYVLASDREVDAVFAPELAARPPAQRARLQAALHLATCVAGWDVLRDDRGLDAEGAGAVLHDAVVGLLAARGSTEES